MSAPTFRIELIAGDDGATTVAVAGEFDAARVETFERATGGLGDGRTRTLVVDLVDTSILDSAALGALVRLRRRVVSSGQSFTVEVGRRFQRDLLATTGLWDLLAVRDVETHLTRPGEHGDELPERGSSS